MSAIIIEKVKDNKGLDAFIQFHYDLYKGNEYSVPNLYSDEVRTLSKDKNAAFEFCEAEYFLAYKDGKVVGRVAGIINKKANEKWGRKTVRFGWIDFVDDIEVSSALLNAVEQWGKEKGMAEIAGSAYVVLFGSFVSYLLMIVGQRHLEPPTVTAYNYIQPIIAATVGILLGVDVLTWQKVVAVLCIAAGVWAISRKTA